MPQKIPHSRQMPLKSEKNLLPNQHHRLAPVDPGRESRWREAIRFYF